MIRKSGPGRFIEGIVLRVYETEIANLTVALLIFASVQWNYN